MTLLDPSTLTDVQRHGLAWAARPADRWTPVQAFQALRVAGREVCLLESVDGPGHLARYSFLATDPRARVVARGGRSRLDIDGESEILEADVSTTLRTALDRLPGPTPPSGLPPLVGGWIGALSHEFVSEIEPSIPRPAREPLEAPDAVFVHFDTVVAFDHGRQQVVAITRCEGGAGDLDRARSSIERLFDDLDREVPEPRELPDSAVPFTEARSPEAFLEGVERIRDGVAAGEIFQAVLSRRWSRPFAGDPFLLYRALRITNPAPHMFFFEAEGLTCVGSSPERLVALQGGRCQAVPIAGTRPRGTDDAEDERLGRELQRDTKERAEHDMLVDLARNDLGRVARTGTVQVTQHARLERFPRVQHLVSHVEATLRDGCDSVDLVRACFPAGTVSGAPKVRALQFVAEIEGEARGPYGGAFGYLGPQGLDLAITIRTLVVHRGHVHVQAGAGIVFDSDPQRELEETEHKARALFEAVRLAESLAGGCRTLEVAS